MSPARSAAAAFLVVFAGLLAMSTAAQAQTLTTFVSNTGLTEDPNSTSGFNAQSFTTGTNVGGYTISEVSIRLKDVAGRNTRVRIREDSGGEPATGNPVATLTNPGTLTEESLNTFMAPTGTTLNARKTYWITVNEEIAAGSDRVSFARATANDETGEPGWSIGDNRLFRSSETGNWVDSPTSLLIAIKGTTGGITASTDATLSDLELEDPDGNAISLSPTFASGTIGYTASVTNAVDEVTLTATVNHAGPSVSAVTLNGNVIADSDFTNGITVPSLVVGDNTIVVTVTAEDASTTKTYTVTVTRGGQTNTPAMGKPSITGTAQVGQTLTAATTGIADTDGKTKAENGDTGYAYTYQWVRVDGSNETDITGAASKTYIPAAADVGKTIKVQVSFTDDAGNPEELTSDPAGPVAQTVPIGLEANYPSIGAGLDDLVFTLTRTGAVKDELEGTVSIVQAQKWLGASDLSRTVTFALSDEVRAAPAMGKPSIRGMAGKAWVGGTLRVVTTDITDEDGLSGATYGYQWVRVDADGMSNATDITSETSDTYVPVEADVGKKVHVKVSFTDDGGGNEELTSDAYPSSGTIEAEAPGICERTRQVRVGILDRIPNVGDCARVTDARLANITGELELNGKSIDTLAAGDFAGLTALTTLNLESNALTTLPDDVFEPLTALTGLYLNSNKLRTLDAGVFAGLPLQDLRLSSNKLTTLDAGVFAGLTALQELNLSTNKLTTLDAGVFAGLPALETLRLAGNMLTTLDAGVFAGLPALETLPSGKQRFGHAGRRGVRRADRAGDAASGRQRVGHVARRRVRAADRADGSAVVAQSRGALRAGGGCPAR